MAKISYGEALRDGFIYLLDNYPEVFIIGQGLWSPWYVGNSMTDLDKIYGKDRIIDTPVSESACTGAAVGASLSGTRPIVVHPRIDFMLYAVDSIVNQAAKWSHMTGGQASPNLTVRAIINRGGEQGAQHSQALHAWFAHIPGLRVVMPYSVSDARDLLIASVLSNHPVIFIDDRWLYDDVDEIGSINELNLSSIEPVKLTAGSDLTMVSSSYSSKVCLNALKTLKKDGISADLFDLRVISPLNIENIVKSVTKTGNLIVVDGGWAPCGLSSEIIASVVEQISPFDLKSKPKRVTLPFAPAPSSRALEKIYYFDEKNIINAVLGQG